MVSDFKKKKFLHVFNIFFDADKSGAIDKKDFDVAVERIAKFRGWSSTDAIYKEAVNTLNKVWEGLQKADADKDGSVSQDEWIALWSSFPETSADWQNLYCKFVFQLEDASGDGSIDSQEFSAVYGSFGLDKEEAVTAFQKMANGKAEVSWDEFQALFKEYFSTENVSAPGNYIFGKTSF